MPVTHGSVKINNKHYTTIGMDVSDRKTQVCVMPKTGGSPSVVVEATIPTTRKGLAKFLSTQGVGRSHGGDAQEARRAIRVAVGGPYAGIARDESRSVVRMPPRHWAEMPQGEGIVAKAMAAIQSESA